MTLGMCQKGVSQTKVQVMAMCHKLRGGKSKILDKEIRNNPRKPIGRRHVAKRTSHLAHIGPNSVCVCVGGGGGGGRGEKRENRKRKKSRERSSHFSLDFPAIRTLTFVRARDKVDPRGKSFE